MPLSHVEQSEGVTKVKNTSTKGKRKSNLGRVSDIGVSVKSKKMLSPENKTKGKISSNKLSQKQRSNSSETERARESIRQYLNSEKDSPVMNSISKESKQIESDKHDNNTASSEACKSKRSLSGEEGSDYCLRSKGMRNLEQIGEASLNQEGINAKNNASEADNLSQASISAGEEDNNDTNTESFTEVLKAI